MRVRRGIAEHAGMKLPYTVDGDGVGPAVVFAHGLMGTGAGQRAQLGPLVDAGWTVVTFDQRGHAHATPVLESGGYDAELMGGDLWAVAEAAGLARCWIGGGSMGAATSFRAATSRPDGVEGLIQAIPAIRDEHHPLAFAFEALADNLRDAGIEGLITTLRTLVESMGAQETDELFLEELRTHEPSSLETALRTVPRWILPDVPAAFSDLPFPVVVLGWENDPIHPMQTARDIASAAGADVVELDQATALVDRGALGRELTRALQGVRT